MPDTERICRRVVVRGDVQGVFFRDSARERADQAGVTGWAANRADGSVELRLEGTLEAVQSVIAFCRHGPPRARVDGVEVSDCAPEGASRFQIR